MNGIIGMTELTLDTELAPNQREYLQMVKSSADALLTIINDILDFSKIEAGKLDLNPTSFHLRDTLANAIKPLAIRAHQKELELSLDVEPVIPEMIVADSGRLRQILVNLIGNAIKFTEAGEVVLRVSLKSLTERCMVLEFVVSDTGIGIATAKQSLIFEAFSQADMSTSRRYGGTGLGLAICKRLVELMNGTIWVESEPDRGSTFRFVVKVETASATTATGPEAIPASNLYGLPVLIVDDNRTNRNILQNILVGWRMNPTIVESGDEALATLQKAQKDQRPFGLVLLDCNMPYMDGFTVAERI
jgi:signal transduction histidine kinase